MRSEKDLPSLDTEVTLSPEVKKALAELDELDDINSSEKIDILGAFIGLKPVAFPYQYYGEDWRPDLENLKRIVESLGLAIVTKLDPIDEDGQGHWEAAVSADSQKIEEFLAIKNRYDLGPEQELKVGRLLGYPETSIQAFTRKIPLLPRTEYENLRASNLAAFFQKAALSQDFWQDELKEYGEKLVIATKKFLPQTFQQRLNIFRGSSK